MEWEKFNFIWSNIDNKGHHFTYVLDSNVVVGLSNFYYGRIKDEAKKIRYKKLYEYLYNNDVAPGLAIRELSWDVEKNIVDKDKENKLIIAMDELFAGHNKGIKENSYNRRMKFNSIIENKESNQLLLMSCCLLKKLANLYRSEKSNELIYIKLIDFIINEHKMVLSYELILITYWLLGTNSKLKNLLPKLLKINSKNITEWQIYNASWDIFFIRSINSMTAMSRDNQTIAEIYNVCFITEDKALSELGELTIINNDVTHLIMNGITMPTVSIDIEYIKDEYVELVTEKMTYLVKTFDERKNFIQDNSDIINYYVKLLNKLNNEF